MATEKADARTNGGTPSRRGTTAAGFPTEQWTQARVMQVIQREFSLVNINNESW